MLRLVAVRMLPVVLLLTAAGFWFHDVQDGGPHVARNLVPPAIVLLLAFVTLWRGGGHWTGSGWRWLLGTAGYAVPALGLSVYLHYAYAVNLDDMFGASTESGQLFRVFNPVLCQLRSIEMCDRTCSLL